jgi:hypothetical protein
MLRFESINASLRRVLIFGAVGAISLTFTASAAQAGDAPAGFFWGSDSNGPAPSSSVSTCASSAAPWLEPYITNSGCGHYGGYFGEIGGYWTILGCSANNAWNSTAAGEAKANFADDNDGIGTAAYFFMGGPGMDPSYNGTTSEASNWGKLQAEEAVSLAGTHSNWDDSIIVGDVEDFPGQDTGWNETMSQCWTLKSSAPISAAVDQATLNGFWQYIYDDTDDWAAIYSVASTWAGIFGTGSDATMTNVSEITANFGGNCANPGPISWTQSAGSCSSNSALFFGGIGGGSDCALGWQWANPSSTADYDQFESYNWLACD